MMQKEQLALFRSAAWNSPEEMAGFVASCEPLQPPDVLKLLEVVAHRSSAAEPQQHRVRCVVFGLMAERCGSKALFAPFVQALKAADPVLRQALVELLPKVNNIAEHGALCALLRSPDEALRRTVATLLQRIGGRTVFELLAGAVRERDFPGRLEAVEVLVRTAGHYAIPALHAALPVSRPPERQAILRLLGDARFVQGDVPAALQALASALNDSHEPVALLAIQGYAALCSEDAWFGTLSPALESPSLAVVRTALEGLRRFPGRRTLQVLERKLRSGPNAVRLVVLGVLEQLGGDDVLPLLVEALGHRQLSVRTRAAEVLASLSRSGRVHLVRTILSLLRSREADVRRMAVDLVRSVPDPDEQLWPRLLTLLRDDDWWVRERVVDVLVELAGQRLTRHVVPYLQDPSEVVRRYALDVLARLKDPQALGALLRTASTDADWWAREKAVEAVAALGDARAIPPLMALLERETDLRPALLGALGQLCATQAGPQVAALLAAPEPDVRLAALACLRALGDTSHASAVQPLAQDAHPQVRTRARELLHGWSVALAGEAAAGPQGRTPLDQLLVAMSRAGGDDLILGPNRVPMVKRLGRVVPLARNVLTGEQVKAVLLPHLTGAQLAELQAMRDVDFSHEVKGEGLRFRAHVFQQAGGFGAVFRGIKGTLVAAEALGLPKVVTDLAHLSHGLVLVGGPTGSGKSTTLAAIVDSINREAEGRHVISLEDPIEVLHTRKRGLVNQREIGTHTRSFSHALRATLRQDPDVILVGEMRDLATIAFAVTAAETGHLVFGTVHTVSADSTVDRLINAFPPGQQDQVRAMLSESLRAVVCQYLLQRKDGHGRVLSLEVMLNNDAIAALIRKAKTFQIESVVATSREAGMQLMDHDLMRLYREGLVSAEEVYVKARNKKEFESLLAQPAPDAGAPAVAPMQTGAPGPTARAG